MVHRAGKAGWLNPYVRPQTSACFSRYAPERWSRVAVITDQEALGELAGQLSPGSNWSAIHAHASPSAPRAPPDVVALRPPLWGGVHVAQLPDSSLRWSRGFLYHHTSINAVKKYSKERKNTAYNQICLDFSSIATRTRFVFFYSAAIPYFGGGLLGIFN